MRVYLGSDHAGYELKGDLVVYLTDLGHQVVDVGPHRFDPEDDYPAFCLVTAARVVADPGSLGVVIGGSGNGEQIAANKVPGARVALAWSEQTARLAREHNDANLIGLGARMHSREEAFGMVRAFLETPYSAEERHGRRIGQIREYERSRQLPSLP
ncbi:MAG TPA: ribose-5-phosphate isomerase [Micromonosporaceae bacterium]|jgi:ribose 5-phosphate isomerase B